MNNQQPRSLSITEHTNSNGLLPLTTTPSAKEGNDETTKLSTKSSEPDPEKTLGLTMKEAKGMTLIEIVTSTEAYSHARNKPYASTTKTPNAGIQPLSSTINDLDIQPIAVKSKGTQDANAEKTKGHRFRHDHPFCQHNTPSTSASRPSESNDAHRKHADWCFICKAIRRIIIKRIPEEKRVKYSIQQINKQTMIYESFLYHYKLTYDMYRDIRTLENRVIRCAKMAQGTLKLGLKRPPLIVEINTEKK